jgi:hypothetical protein
LFNSKKYVPFYFKRNVRFSKTSELKRFIDKKKTIGKPKGKEKKREYLLLGCRGKAHN